MMKVVTHSSQSEYVRLIDAANEVLYLSQLQEEMGIGGESYWWGTMNHPSNLQLIQSSISALSTSEQSITH